MKTAPIKFANLQHFFNGSFFKTFIYRVTDEASSAQTMDGPSSFSLIISLSAYYMKIDALTMQKSGLLV